MNLSLASVDASVLWLMAVSVPAAIAFWCCHKWRKTVAVVIAVASGLLVIGVPEWRDALASIATTPKALALLCVPFGVTGALFGVHIHSIRKHKTPKADPKNPAAVAVPPREEHYHHRWTIILGIIAGTTGGMIFLDGVNVLRNLSKAPAGTAAAWSIASKSVTNGTAAKAAAAGSIPPMGYVAIGVIALIAVAWAMGRNKHVQAQTRPRNGRRALGGRRPAAIGGGSQAGGPSTRLGVPASSGPPARIGGK